MPVSSYSRKTYWLFAPSMYPSAICFPSLCCCDMRIFATALRLVCGELPSRLTKQRGSGGSHCLLLLLFSRLFGPGGRGARGGGRAGGGGAGGPRRRGRGRGRAPGGRL